MSERIFEGYYTNPTSTGYAAFAYDMEWFAEIFTPKVNHTITKIQFKCYRKPAGPSTVTVRIRATSAYLPIGVDLATGSLDGDTFKLSPTGAVITGDVYTWTLAPAVTVYTGVPFAVIISGSLPIANLVGVNAYSSQVSQPSIIDPNGILCHSGSAGVNWKLQASLGNPKVNLYCAVIGELVDIIQPEQQSSSQSISDASFEGSRMRTVRHVLPFEPWTA